MEQKDLVMEGGIVGIGINLVCCPACNTHVRNDIVYNTDTAIHKQHIYDDAYTITVTSLAEYLGQGVTHHAALILVVRVVIGCLAFYSLWLIAGQTKTHCMHTLSARLVSDSVEP